MLNWTKTNDYIQAETKNFKFNDKLAMFDLDSTLIEPKIGTKGNGKGFPIDENDWILKYIFIKEFLTELSKKKYSIIIISNQNGISKGKQSFESFTNKINQICKELNLETYIFCSINDNKYRKPRPAWFYEILPDIIFNKIDRKLSFYCGDAAGRTGDFSDCDYKFALNCLLYFHTPESLFLNQYNRSYLTFLASNRWIAFNLDVITAFIVFGSSLVGVFLKTSFTSTYIAFALLYILRLATSLQYFIRQSAEAEANMTSVERLLEYSDLPPEESLHESECSTPNDWPSKGQISIEIFTMRYRAIM
jgi:DNA 3'-phosphatase